MRCYDSSMQKLPNSLYTAAQVRELDRIAIEEFAIPGIELMQRAGKAAYDEMRRRWPKARRIAVLCGTGNNGGDGFVLARLAHEAGLEVRLLQLGEGKRLKGSARDMAELFVGTGLSIENFSKGCDLGGSEVIVDALLGTGFAGEVSVDYAQAIKAMNQSGAGILALDIPSGLHADTGMASGACVHADVTVTFIALKQGLFTGQGPHYCGDIVYHDLRISPQVLMKIPPQAGLLSVAALAHHLAPRSRSAHKGYYGHVLVIGGESGMGGAVRLAGEAALRVGAGLVSVACRLEHATAISQARPELMCHGVQSAAELRPLLAKATVLAIGPGLGQGVWARELFSAALECGKPMVVDADALNLLAADPLRRDDWVLTPHPGEAGRLLGTDSQRVQADRFAAARELQSRYGGMLVLKGAGSLVCNRDQSIGVCRAGNPGMASGGMGDVLTGVIAGLMAQLGGDNNAERSTLLAARLGTCLHAQAADSAAREAGERGLLASDLMPWLQAGSNPANNPARGY